MAVNFTTTKSAGKYIKMLCYGRSGMGKTTLISTAPSPLVISTENKLLAISAFDIPVIEVHSVDDFEEAVDFCNSKKAKKFETICVDSITDIAEACLSDLMKEYSDGRKAYGELAAVMGDQIRALRDIRKKNIYCIAKAKRASEDGIERFFPSMPGNTLTNNLPYFFDFVIPLRINDDEDDPFRYLQTQPDWKYDAKSYGKKLEVKEDPNLTKFFKKALS